MTLETAASDIVRAFSRLSALADALDYFADLSDRMDKPESAHAYRWAAKDIRAALSGHRLDSLSPETWHSIDALSALLPLDGEAS